ncbi:hypothetical protein [Paracidovorax cattleyae]|uniref:hypothetical protein n=1 Tax=Paracidovorax cattleyae TaxID=80868 RepID=UPI0018AF64B4|nr:hypothetical protein [Paracidovorax cattleyae]MBF9264286.1 hypothetical protein [Paracidovorax cattleyae]
MNTLNPARTRQDCIDWLTLEEVEQEVFAAFVGARQHAQQFDFAAYHAEASDNDPGLAVLPGTVCFAEGENAWDRWSFLEYMLAGVVWRLEALAKRKGVDLQYFDLGNLLGSGAFRDKGFADPYFAFLGGEVQTVTDADIDAMPDAQRRALKAAIKAGKPVTLPKGALGAV